MDLYTLYTTYILEKRLFDSYLDFFRDNFSVSAEMYAKVKESTDKELKEVTAEVKKFVHEILQPRFTKFYEKFETEMLGHVISGKTDNQAQNDILYTEILRKMLPELSMDGDPISYKHNCIGMDIYNNNKLYDQPVLMTHGFVETGVNFLQFVYHWMHKLKLLLLVDLGQPTLFMCHGDKHNMKETKEFKYMIMYGCNKPDKFDVENRCLGIEGSIFPEFSKSMNFIYTYDTNLLSLPFFSTKQSVQRFNKQHRDPINKRNGVFANVFIIRCLFPGFYGLKDRRFYDGVSPTADVDRQLISSGYHKLLKGYARFVLSMISKDAVNSLDTKVGLVVSIENIGGKVKNISEAPGFGLFSQYLMALSDNHIMGRRYLVDTNTIVLSHKIVKPGTNLSSMKYLPISINDDQLKIPVKGDGYREYRVKAVGDAAQKYYKEDSVASENSIVSRGSNSWEVVNKEEVINSSGKCVNGTRKKNTNRCVISGGASSKTMRKTK